MVIQGILVEINELGNRAIVSIDGAPRVPMMAVSTGIYVEGEIVNVLRNPFGGGDQYMCLGPAGGDTADLPTAPEVGATTAPTTVTLRPEWTGTWDADSGRYDNWNVSRTEYGGRSTLYQGDRFGSGPLTGLATYGNQIVALGASEITAMLVTLRGAGLALDLYPAVKVQAATNGAASSAPSSAGTVVTGAPGKSGVVQVALDASVFAGYRAGTYKGLALVGVGYAEYNAVRGTSDADGMALTITYTRPI